MEFKFIHRELNQTILLLYSKVTNPCVIFSNQFSEATKIINLFKCICQVSKVKDFKYFAESETDKAVNRHSVLLMIVEFVVSLIQQKEVSLDLSNYRLWTSTIHSMRFA